MSTITIIPVLKDNYSYVLTTGDGVTAVIDPGEAAPVIDYLDKHNLSCAYILNTHHHGDHIAGNQAIKDAFGATLIAPDAEKDKIGGVDRPVKDGERLRIGDEDIHVIATPGHTSGHVVFYLPRSNILFSGDTLFSMGCGRLFEGTPDEMWRSLEALMALPDETQIYCGHEYTLSNAAFCRTIEPDNPALLARIQQAEACRAENKPTIPVSLATEKATNIFLRARNAAHFADLRRQKDSA